MSKSLFFSILTVFVVLPALVQACACGCGVFDVGTGVMMPTSEGGTVWLEYDWMNQNKNWAGTGRSDPANNQDKKITTDFITAGGQYMFNRTWGAEIEIPYWNRSFTTTNDDNEITRSQHHALGDIRVKGIYAGLSDDMSTGLTYGLKLPTGDRSYGGFDRDTAIGTGSTDWLLGLYHMGTLSTDAKLNLFVTGQWDHAFTAVDHYRPGDEWDTALGSYYDAGSIVGGDKISPLLQLIGSYRLHDVGARANPQDSGYRRLLISPGFEYDVRDIKLYADVEVPIYQNVNGNQLTAPVQTKLVVGYNF